jgi:hypothetical protein
VVPVAEFGEGLGMRGKSTAPEETSPPLTAHRPVFPMPHDSREGRE